MNLKGLSPLVKNKMLAHFLHSIYSILVEPLQCVRTYGQKFFKSLQIRLILQPMRVLAFVFVWFIMYRCESYIELRSVHVMLCYVQYK
jgi:hypothetical protein